VQGIVYAIGYLAYSAWQSHRARDGANQDLHFCHLAHSRVRADPRRTWFRTLSL